MLRARANAQSHATLGSSEQDWTLRSWCGMTSTSLFIPLHAKVDDQYTEKTVNAIIRYVMMLLQLSKD